MNTNNIPEQNSTKNFLPCMKFSKLPESVYFQFICYIFYGCTTKYAKFIKPESGDTDFSQYFPSISFSVLQFSYSLELLMYTVLTEKECFSLYAS